MELSGSIRDEAADKRRSRKKELCRENRKETLMKKQKGRRILSMLLSVALMFSIMPSGYMKADAAAETGGGTCGAEGNEENVKWSYDGEGTLTISGMGEMADFEQDESPWYKFRTKTTKIIIEDGITSIGRYSFCNFGLVDKIIYPKDSLKHIGYRAFAYNGALRNITIPESVTMIDTAAYYACCALEEVRIPGGVSAISEYTFWACYELKNIVLEEGVSEIRSGAFGGDLILQRIELPGTITKIAANAFEASGSRSLVVYGKTEYAREFADVNEWAYVDVANVYHLENADIRMGNRYLYTGQEVTPVPQIIYHMDGNDVTLYPESDFKLEYSNNIECGTASIMIMGLGCYTGNRELTYDIFQPASNDYGTCGAEGNEGDVIWIYDGDGTLTISGIGEMSDFEQGGSPWYKFRNKTTKIIIEDGITSIGCTSFYNFGLVDEIEYPKDSLKGIGAAAFASNGMLRSITIPESVTRIGDHAYHSCSSLEEVRIPGSVSIISEGTFGHCSNLKNIVLEEGVSEIQDRAFGDDLILQRIELPGTITKIAAQTFGDSKDSSPIIYGKTDCVKEFALENGYIYVDAKKRYNLENCFIQLDNDQYIYTGNAIQPTFSVMYDIDGSRIPLYQSYDYEVSYSDNIEQGTAVATVTGRGNYTGSKNVAYTIYTPISDCEINLSYTNIQYDGSEKKPDVEVKFQGKELTEGEDYILTYSNNIEEGEAQVTITGIDGYKGSKILYYQINKNSLEDCEVNLAYDSISYDGSEKKPDVEVKYQGNKLTEGTDYSLTYENTVEEGTATVTIIGKGAYKGTKTISYWIYKKSLEDCEENIAYTSVQADGTAKRPHITVKNENGDLLNENTDYILEYRNNIYPGEAVVTIIGKGIYKGKKEVSYQITGISVEKAEVVLNETIFTYDGSPKCPSVSVNMNGKTLMSERDYQVSYRDNVNEGTAYVIIRGMGIYTDAISIGFTILPYSAGKESVYDKGDTLISGNYIYEVTDDENYELELSGTSQKNISNVVIPATVKSGGITYKVTSIGVKAFYKNAKIRKVTIGNNVENIENYAFYGCRNITSVKFGRNVELIGGSSFRKCTKLASITLPKSMEELGKNAFYGCKKLKTITINASSVIDIEENAIKGISKKAVIKVPSKHLKKYRKKFKTNTGYKKTMKIKKK